MLGIGAAHRNDPDGIAWKQNKDFEILLKRLNEAGAIDGGDTSPKVEDGGDAVGKEGGNDETEKKRKRDEGLDDVAEKNAKKIRRKGAEDKKSKRSKQSIAEVTKNTEVSEDDDTSETLTISTYIPRHRA
jgi:Pin2-interacting protein X1